MAEENNALQYIQFIGSRFSHVQEFGFARG
jgi:hypothetical protein